MRIKRAGGGVANATDCKSVVLWTSGVQVPPCPPRREKLLRNFSTWLARDEIL